MIKTFAGKLLVGVLDRPLGAVPSLGKLADGGKLVARFEPALQDVQPDRTSDPNVSGSSMKDFPKELYQENGETLIKVYLTRYNNTCDTMNNNFVEIVSLTFYISGSALLISAFFGIPLGAWWGFHPFRGRKMTTALLYTGMGLPPVVVGLFVYLLLSRSGPVGGLNSPLLPRLFTPGAMILAQVVIAFPVVAGLTMAAVMGVSQPMRWQIQALGADKAQTIRAVLWEARRGVILALVAGFRRDHLRGWRGDACGWEHCRKNTRAHHRDRVGNPPGEFPVRAAIGYRPLDHRFHH